MVLRVRIITIKAAMKQSRREDSVASGLNLRGVPNVAITGQEKLAVFLPRCFECTDSSDIDIGEKT